MVARGALGRAVPRAASARRRGALRRASQPPLRKLPACDARSVAERLHDPHLSITLGTHYFASLLQRYQGNLVLALAGYNAGPGRAARWREQWASLPTDEFIEHIPLDETRQYVKLILRNLMIYERLYKAL
jgi:soluble lytic murein transglycosylase-like protein